MSFVTVDQIIGDLEKYRGYYVAALCLEARQNNQEETRVHISLSSEETTHQSVAKESFFKV
jgi:hypothetical protein